MDYLSHEDETEHAEAAEKAAHVSISLGRNREETDHAAVPKRAADVPISPGPDREETEHATVPKRAVDVLISPVKDTRTGPMTRPKGHEDMSPRVHFRLSPRGSNRTRGMSSKSLRHTHDHRTYWAPPELLRDGKPRA